MPKLYIADTGLPLATDVLVRRSPGNISRFHWSFPGEFLSCYANR